MEVVNVGGWLTHGDVALEAEVDNLVVVEHQLIPAGVLSEWAWLKSEALASIRAPASQDSSHGGNAGVEVVSMRGVLVALPTLPLPSFSVSLMLRSCSLVLASFWEWSVHELGGDVRVSGC